VESRIRHLHYRVLAAPGARVPPGLERVARERVGEALGEALDAALGEDPGVYVLRRVRADISVDVGASPPDRLIAREWAHRLAAAITRSIAEEGDDEVVRFADEAEFIARFAADLADGVAWERWYYGAFAELRPLGNRSALRTLVLDHRRQLPAILAWLTRHGSLERVLAALDPGTLASLERRLPDSDLVRPLVVAALRIADALKFTVGHAAPDEILDRYLAAATVAPTWRDRGSLAQAVLDAFRYLLREGDLAPLGPRRAQQAAARLEPLLGELDWLDVNRLRTGLQELLAVGAAPPALARRGARSGAAFALVDELAATAAAGPIAFDVRDPAGAANALRLRAALAARSPAAAARPEVAETIAAVLAAVERLARHRAAPEVWALIAAGDAVAAFRRYAGMGGSREDVELLAEAEPLVRSFAPSSPTALTVAGAQWIDSACAGALLPVRGALDLRLPALAAAAEDVPPFPELLLALALRWAGEGALGQRADAGLAAALGFAEPPTAEALAGGWAGCTRTTQRRLRADVLRGLEARGLRQSVGKEQLACVQHSTLGDPQTDRTVGIVAVAVLLAWTGWLRGFGESSPAFVLDQFVRRPGAISLSEGCAAVELERRPLDLVLEMAGYLGELDAGAVLPRRISFSLAGG
jgi:hypothetical protein